MANNYQRMTQIFPHFELEENDEVRFRAGSRTRQTLTPGLSLHAKLGEGSPEAWAWITGGCPPELGVGNADANCPTPYFVMF